MDNLKKVLIFAGNHQQATDFIRNHRFLTPATAEYCCSEERIRGSGSEKDPMYYILAGEFWLNPAYRGHYLSQMQDIERAIELKNDKTVCEYLGIDWVPADLGIIINEVVDSEDKIV